jgi:hypothetical protein
MTNWGTHRHPGLMMPEPFRESARGGHELTDQGLSRFDFRQVAAHGWGDPFNSYAYSMAWFQDALYVGNSRGNLVMIHRNHPEWMNKWPVRIPNEFHDLDFRAQIWRYRPMSSVWEHIHSSPRVPGRNGLMIPRDIGYRSMAVLRDALYVAGFSPASSGLPPQILRSCNGNKFDGISTLGTNAELNTYRVLQVFGRYLYTSPTGKSGGEANASNSAVVFQVEDPATQPWRPVSERGFGDAHNQTCFEMASFNNKLYVGTLNPISGFQIWKTDGQQQPFKWSRVIANGAYRGNLNELAISMCVFKGALYVGTAVQNGGYDRLNKVGPAAPELIRIHPDDSWDLIVGTPRATPDGRKFPLSGKGPGFDNPFNGYFWRMAVHNGSLYLGTYKWTVFLPYTSSDKWPFDFQNIVGQIGIDELAYFAGGCDLWRSPDGVNWLPVTRNGFDNPYNYGIRTLQSTPYGLFVGTANPFGPDVAVRVSKTKSGNDKWEFRPNAKAGLEIWLGTEHHHHSDLLRNHSRSLDLKRDRNRRSRGRL